MNFLYKSKTTIFWILLFSIVGFYFISILFFGTTTFADPIRGYEIMNQYISDGKWNTLNYPSIKHPEFSYFVSWWAPAQWVVPFLIMKIFNIESFQTIQSLLITISLSIAIFGYYKLFRKFGLSLNITLISLICIITNQTFYWQILMYNGGDLFLLALFPIYIILTLKLKDDQKIRNVLLFFSFTLIGCFIKNSFILIAFSSCLFLFFSSNKKEFLQRIKATLIPFLVFGLIASIINYFYFSLGETPGKTIDLIGFSGIHNDIIGDLTYAIGSPVGIFIHLTFYIQKIYFLFFDKVNYSNSIQIIPAILTISFLVKISRIERTIYYSILLYFCIPFFIQMTSLYLLDKSVSYEMRHFAPFSFLFFPGLIYFISNYKYKKILFFLFFFICLSGLRSYILNLKTIEKTSSFWNTLKLPNNEVELLKEINKLDKSSENALFLIEDKWLFSIGVKENDKIVVTKELEKYSVVSGMGLEEVDLIQINDSLFNKYQSIFIVSSNCKSNGLIKIVTDNNFTGLKKKAQFSIYKLNRSLNKIPNKI